MLRGLVVEDGLTVFDRKPITRIMVHPHHPLPSRIEAIGHIEAERFFPDVHHRFTHAL